MTHRVAATKENRHPWGYSWVLAQNRDRVTAKLLTVYPGESLSLQRHQHRDELWMVVAGQPHVQIGTDRWRAWQWSMYEIPAGVTHRLWVMKGDQPAKVVELAFGTFDDEDIERLDDVYGRA